MPIHYQQKSNNPYRLPDNLYRRVLYTVKDYDRRKAEYYELLEYVPPVLSGISVNIDVSDPTANKAIKLAEISGELHAVEAAAMMIDEPFRSAILRNLKYDEPLPFGDFSHRPTWYAKRRRFLYSVAVLLKLL